MSNLRSMALGFAVVASGLIVVNGVDHMNDRPLVPGYVWSARVATPPMPAPDAFLCEFGCPGYVPPPDGLATLAEAEAMAASQRAAAGYWAGQKGAKVQGVPTNGVVTVHVAAPVTAGQQATPPKQGKAISAKAPRQASGSKAGKAPAAPKQPKPQKQPQPSTTTTTKQSTTTKANGTTTTSTTTTTKRTG